MNNLSFDHELKMRLKLKIQYSESDEVFVPFRLGLIKSAIKSNRNYPWRIMKPANEVIKPRNDHKPILTGRLFE